MHFIYLAEFFPNLQLSVDDVDRHDDLHPYEALLPTVVHIHMLPPLLLYAGVR